ncbi:MAG TPA: SRPBCC family protein [Xanthomonadales bacterium]|nr:SRPBCC family protein [Xanthomonadales bacterium]
MKIVAPVRATRTYTQRLAGAPAAVFPLLCPVREADWIEGWDPLLVVSSSGVAEPDCVFTTRAEPTDAIWYVTRHEPGAGFVEMLKITPGVTACRLTIQLRAVAGGSEADVTYSHTSLGPAGDAFVAAFTEAHYRDFMRDWEARMNHYLEQGTVLELADERPAAAREFVHSRVIEAAPGRVFDAIRDPARLARWWGPNGFTSTVHAFEFRPGGALRLTLHAPDGADYPNDYVFAGIEAPQRVVIERPGEAHHFVLTITLDPHERGTRVGWRQVFDTAEERARLAPVVPDANEQNLDRLAAEALRTP